jgi:hypothetical protein
LLLIPQSILQREYGGAVVKQGGHQLREMCIGSGLQCNQDHVRLGHILRPTVDAKLVGREAEIAGMALDIQSV